MRFLDKAGLRGPLFSRAGDASGSGIRNTQDDTGKVGPQAVTPGESERVGGKNNVTTGESDTGGPAGGVSGSALANRPSGGPGAGGSDLGGVGGTGGGTGGGGGETALGTLSTGAGTDLGGGTDSGSGDDLEEMAESVKRSTEQQ